MDAYNASFTPAANPPPGIISNFVDPPSEKNVVVAYTTVFTIVSTLGVAIRMYVRCCLMKKVQIEDYLLVLSWMLFMVFNGLVYTAAIASVMGRHAWDVSLIQLQYFLWLLNTLTVVYGPMLICGKGALILLWGRIFAGTANRLALWWFLRVLLYINTAVYVCGMTIQIFNCTPRAKIWKPWLDGYCVNTEASLLYTAAWNLFLDVALLVVPLFSVRNLRIQKKRKWLLMGCFALGVITCTASILRIVNAVELANSAGQIYNEQNSIWSADLEQTGVILVTCSPTFSKLYRHLRGEADDDNAHDKSLQQSSETQAASPGFASSRTCIELGNEKDSSRIGTDANQQGEESDNENELDYHAIKRTESLNRPLKIRVRNDITISNAATSGMPSTTRYGARTRNGSTLA